MQIERWTTQNDAKLTEIWGRLSGARWDEEGNVSEVVPNDEWSDLNDLRRVGKVGSSRFRRQNIGGRGAGDLGISLWNKIGVSISQTLYLWNCWTKLGVYGVIMKLLTRRFERPNCETIRAKLTEIERKHMSKPMCEVWDLKKVGQKRRVKVILTEEWCWKSGKGLYWRENECNVH